MPDERDLEAHPHLAERLKEARDVADFSSRRAEAPTEVSSTYAMPEHLGGRSVSDTFVRGGTPPQSPPEPTTQKGLPAHLKSRLAEVSDELRTGARDPIEAYRQRRRQLGGS